MRLNYQFFFRRTSIFNSVSITRFLSSDLKHTSFQIPYDVHSNSSLIHKKRHVCSVHRFISNVYSPPLPPALAGTAVGKDESREFMAVFPDIVRDLTEAGRHLDIPDVTKWYAKVLQYNVPGGKKNRGLALVAAYRIFAHQVPLSEENLRLAHIMAWCVEMLQAFFLVVDDLMDESQERRGRPCWYRLDDIGVMAMNDAILIENGIYLILKKYFHDKPYYLKVLETFHDLTLKTSMGQSLDMLTSNSFKSLKKLDKFTMDRYKAVVKYKTSYYSFQLPIALAMYMAGISDPEQHRQVKYVLLEMGEMFQIQDDFLDCFGDLRLLGKSGTDIEIGKCTWLIVVALQRANARQRAVLEESYGKPDKDKIEAVKNVYKEIGLPAIFAAYEEDAYNMIVLRIQQLSRGLPHEVFFKILDKIYKRAA